MRMVLEEVLNLFTEINCPMKFDFEWPFGLFKYN
jgi:hypothetical protein